MNKGQFATQINQAERILKTLGLLKERVAFPTYVDCSAATFRGLSYFDSWKKCYDDRLYDLRLTDDSLIQFRSDSFTPLSVSYAYYECPYKPIVPFDVFVEQEKFTHSEDRDEYDLLREYGLLTPEVKETVTPIRYDYNPSLYREGCHPAAHMHFGHKNNIRVGARKILKPLSFVLFVVRQYYPEKWEAFTSSKGAEIHCRNVRENLEDVEIGYWQKLDHWEMTLV